MSSVNLKQSSVASNNALVEQILEQGQRLRNSMVQAILNNDPFNNEIISNKNLQYPKFKSPSEIKVPDSGKELPSTSSFLETPPCEDENKLAAPNTDKLFYFLRGDLMSREDEIVALDTLRTISPSEFVKKSKEIVKRHCDCDICKEAENCNETGPTAEQPLSTTRLENSKCDINEKPLRECLASLEHLKFVNTIKILVHNLKLNATGRRKIFFSKIDKKPAISVSKTFFVEYSIPPEFSKRTKQPTKVNSGLDLNKPTRFCSKKLFEQEAIYFKQMSIHDIFNVYNCKLNEIYLKFRISCRTMNEKKALTFGEAILNMETVMYNPLFIANQELAIVDINSGMTLGSLKVSIMLGCDKIHFGEEFIDAINSNKGNASLSSNDSVFKATEEPIHKNVYVPVISTKVLSPKKTEIANKKLISPKTITPRSEPQMMRTKIISEERLLYGLIYVSEANYLQNAVDSYIISHSFHNNDPVVSRIFHNNLNPAFNFYQLEPILYNDEFLAHMRENYIVLEFWEKCENNQDILIGISKLSLHQFYITYRNPAIVKHLLKNQHPVISVDWWEPIVNPYNEEICGQTQALLAVGTGAQIHALEVSRGFKESSVIAKRPPTFACLRKPAHKNPIERTTSVIKPSALGSQNEPGRATKKPNTNSICTVDIGVQSNMEPEKPESKTLNDHRDVLMNLIEQLETRRNVQNVENSTNTEPQTTQHMEVSETQTSEDILAKKVENSAMVSSNSNSARRETFTVPSNKKNQLFSANSIKQTYDLLASVQCQMKSTDSNVEAQTPKSEGGSFKCHIIIEEALHLPSRKKCKSKRSKGKHIKNDDSIFPSAYVTFETIPGGEVKITKVIAKSSNPKWDFRTDVMIPTDLLFNNQKRLIFKVWRKSNGPNLIPNHQTDLVLGFAALDLTVLMAGLPNIQGWFNIIDFSNKCNGQIKISLTPLENIQKLNKPKPAVNFSSNSTLSHLLSSPESQNAEDIPEDTLAEGKDEPSELLSRALKRKFTELDEITQRLRLRLSKVTNDEDSDVSNDDFSDAFERDINTLCVEDDFDTNNFVTDFQPVQNIPASDGLLQPQPSCSYIQDNAQNALQLLLPTLGTAPNVSATASGGERSSKATDDNVRNASAAFGNHLTQGKLRIDTLLEKLSLITGGNNNEQQRSVVESSFNNRYVSGCSAATDEEQRADSNSKAFVDGIMKELGISTFEEDAAVNSSLLQQFYNSASSASTPTLTDLNSLKELDSNSVTSLMSNDDISRSEPDGEGSVANNGGTNSNANP